MSAQVQISATTLITDSKWSKIARTLNVDPTRVELRSALEGVAVRYLTVDDNRRNRNIRRQVERARRPASRLRSILTSFTRSNDTELELAEIFLSGLEYPRLRIPLLLEGLTAIEKNALRATQGLKTNGRPPNSRIDDLIMGVESALIQNDIRPGAGRIAWVVRELALLDPRSRTYEEDSYKRRVYAKRAAAKRTA